MSSSSDTLILLADESPDFLLQVLRKDITSFVETALVRLRKSLDPSQSLLHQYHDDDDEEDEGTRICRKSFVDFAAQFMRRQNQDHLANGLQISKRFLGCLKVRCGRELTPTDGRALCR